MFGLVWLENNYGGKDRKTDCEKGRSGRRKKGKIRCGFISTLVVSIC